jgi:hypothetical protein
VTPELSKVVFYKNVEVVLHSARPQTNFSTDKNYEMETNVVKFKDWTFEVNKALNEQTYKHISGSGADTCDCNDCKNYVAYRDKVFPIEIIELFSDLGIDFRKEVEIITWETLPNGLHHISGWFHFKGQVLSGKDYRVPLPSGGHTFDLTRITANFSIGFAEGNDLTFFDDKTGLVQIQFDTNIPWVIEKSRETI